MKLSLSVCGTLIQDFSPQKQIVIYKQKANNPLQTYRQTEIVLLMCKLG